MMGHPTMQPAALPYDKRYTIASEFLATAMRLALERAAPPIATERELILWLMGFFNMPATYPQTCAQLQHFLDSCR